MWKDETGYFIAVTSSFLLLWPFFSFLFFVFFFCWQEGIGR